MSGTPIDLEKMRSIGVLGHGRTKNKVVEGVRDDGVKTKATTDELGNTVTEHASKDDRVDVMIRPSTINTKIAVN